MTTWILNKSWYFQGVFELFCVMNKCLARFSLFLTLPMWFVCCRNQLMRIKRKYNYSGMFPKQIKNTSLEDRSSLWNNFCSIHCKDRARLSLDKKGFSNIIFRNSYLWLHRSVFYAFFAIILSSPAESEKNTSMTRSSNREYHLRSLHINKISYSNIKSSSSIIIPL